MKKMRSRWRAAAALCFESEAEREGKRQPADLFVRCALQRQDETDGSGQEETDGYGQEGAPEELTIRWIRPFP